MENNRFGKSGVKNKTRRAFTITELVIVIAVIAILAAVLIPTFSSVIKNSKKSHDEQYVKEINVALSAYKGETGMAPEDYEGLMLVLKDYGLTDESNPFLLATALKQENAYIVWYPNANSVMLISEDTDNLMVTFTSSIGLGNGVFVLDSLGNTSTLGYALCTNGEYNYVAQLYYDFYVTCGGDVTEFITSGSYDAEDIRQNIGNQAWANSIVASLKNQQQGYSHSAKIEASITEQLKTSNSATIDIGEITSGATDSVKVQQAVRSSLATLATMANADDQAEKLAKKTVRFADVEDVEVDMSGVQSTAIGLTYRKEIKEASIANNTPSSFSTDFGGMTIKNFEVKENDFVASGSEWQTAADNGYSGPAYCFTYGLFGTLYAKPGETVTVSNLTVKDVNVNLNGATETIGGQKVAAISDMAGIIAGYTQGNVTFKISRWTAPLWKAKKVRSPATTALPPSSADATALRRMRRITIPFSEDCHISIFPFTATQGFGVRRLPVWARIFPSRQFRENVDITVERKTAALCTLGFSHTRPQETTLTVDGVTAENVTTSVKF
ncbi:MAG: type II secretion system protein [Candidatus Borkfalkia sp.]